MRKGEREGGWVHLMHWVARREGRAGRGPASPQGVCACGFVQLSHSCKGMTAAPVRVRCVCGCGCSALGAATAWREPPAGREHGLTVCLRCSRRLMLRAMPRTGQHPSPVTLPLPPYAHASDHRKACDASTLRPLPTPSFPVRAPPVPVPSGHARVLSHPAAY